MANWYQPPAPAPLDLPEPVPHHHQPPRSFPDFPAPDLFPLQGLQLPIHEHSPASPAASLPDSPAPPLKGLASKFALMMGRGTSPVPSSGGGGGGGSWEATPPTPIRGHGYSKSLGHPASFGWEQPDEGVLSGDEIERLAREERDWSRREAERLMVLENQARAKGQSFSPGLPLDQQEEKTPRKPHARANSYFDASSTPPAAVANRNPQIHTSTTAQSPSHPTQSASQTQTLHALPKEKSPYLLAHTDHPDALDMPSSLIFLARKFEKLEMYSVTHLRALSSRMGDLEERVKEIEGREGVVQVRKEMRQLKGAMAEGFRALESEIEDVARRDRDGFGLGVGDVGGSARQEPQREPEMAAPCLSSSSSTSSHHQSLKTPSPGMGSIEPFPADITPLAINKPTPRSSAALAAPRQDPVSRSPSPGSSSPVPPRKRYTALLSSRTLSTDSTSTSSPLNDAPSPEITSPLALLAADPSSTVNHQARSTPLPSAPFPPGRSQTDVLPSPTRPLFVKSRTPSNLDEALDSPTRRRARSVGASVVSQAEQKRILGEDVKASNRGRAPVGKLISAWERK